MTWYSRTPYKNLHQYEKYNMNVLNISKPKQALEIIVSLARPSKMPAWGYSLPASKCITGSKMEKVKGSTCCKENCYAKRGWYVKRKKVQDILERRLQAIQNPLWTNSMVYMIRYLRCAFFRWHDSGDIQSLVHLDKIFTIARSVPDCIFWLPTREEKIVEKYWNLHGKVPLNRLMPNLVIRLSSAMVDGPPPTELAHKLGVGTSQVLTVDNTCPAMTKFVRTNNGKNELRAGYCGSCRDCWNPEIENVSYLFHASHVGRPRNEK